MPWPDIFSRRRFGAFLAWLAVASLGAVAVARDMAGHDSADGRAAQSWARALGGDHDHVVRVAAGKLTSHVRPDGDGRGTFGGGTAATLPPAILLAARPDGNPDFPVLAGAEAQDEPTAPYAARAPPQAII